MTTLILALPGPAEIVVAADTYVYSDYGAAYYSSTAEKIWKEGKWLIGLAGNEIGKSVLAKIKHDGFNFDRDFDSVASDLAQRTNEVFKSIDAEVRSRHQFNAIMCGVQDGRPRLCEWQASSPFASSCADKPAAIGVKRHGGIFLAYEHYGLSMDTNQRALLAYFAVHAVARQDMRVDTPIHVAIVKKDGPTIYSGDELSEFARRSEEISDSLKCEFEKPGPPFGSVPRSPSSTSEN